MFDIATQRGKAQYQNEMLRLMRRLEPGFANGLSPWLIRQWVLAANAFEHGGDFASAVDQVRFPLAAYLRDSYKRVATVFGNEAFKRFEESEKKKQDSQRNRYWQEINKWAKTEAASKVTLLGRTSKKLIARVIHKGVGEGLSNEDIAKNIVKTGKVTQPWRAKRIARTEVHSASVNAVNEATKSTGVDFEREWHSSVDDRVRGRDPKDVWNHLRSWPKGPNKERRGMEEPFRGTGENLRYPGDPKGAAGNIINCRCVLLYHRAKQVVVEREREEVSVMPFPVTQHGRVTQKHVEEVNDFAPYIPAGVVREGEKYGLHIASADYMSTQDLSLRGVRPRGWPKGTTWDHAGGGYWDSDKRIVVTEYVAEMGRRGELKGSRVGLGRKANVFFHELGHGIDDALGEVSARSAFMEAYRKDAKKIRAKRRARRYSYFLQKGRAGRREIFAQAFSDRMRLKSGGKYMVRGDTEENFPRCYAYLDMVLEGLEEAAK